MSKEDISTGLFINCLYLSSLDDKGLLDSSQAPWVECLTKRLKEVLLASAKALAGERASFSYCSEQPGYLYCAYDNVRVYFPWLIVDDLPDQDVLRYLTSTAGKLKACKLSSICLSGSALYFGSLRSISDIDFLEYIPNLTYHPPQIAPPEGFGVKRKDNCYIEYVVNTPFYGVTEVTSKIVRIYNPAKGPATTDDSFAYQEAPLNPPLLTLHDPVVFGRYIHRLATQVIRYAQTDPSKAAKRLLPLSRATQDREISSSIVNAFNSDLVQNALFVRQKVDLIEKLDRADPCLVEFATKANEEIAKRRGHTATAAELTKYEADVINSLENAIKHIILTNKEKLEHFADA